MADVRCESDGLIVAEVVITITDIGNEVQVNTVGLTKATFDKSLGSHYAAVVALDAIRDALTGNLPTKKEE